MLRLRDARTKELTDVLPAGQRQLRVLVAPGPGLRTLGSVRAYLAADLLRRAAERSRLLPLVSDLLPPGADPAGTDVAALRAACDALNVHPPRDTLAAEAPGLPEVPTFDVGVAVGDRAEVTAMARLWIQVAVDDTSVTLGDEALPVRLILIGNRYDAAVTAGQDEVSAATRDLDRWRRLVAEWARFPSGAMARPYADAVRDALATDLDTPAALSALAALVTDQDVQVGVKFETFAAADMLLGLDLARDIGRG
jgi:hypothetical protein